VPSQLSRTDSWLKPRPLIDKVSILSAVGQQLLCSYTVPTMALLKWAQTHHAVLHPMGTPTHFPLTCPRTLPEGHNKLKTLMMSMLIISSWKVKWQEAGGGWRHECSASVDSALAVLAHTNELNFYSWVEFVQLSRNFYCSQCQPNWNFSAASRTVSLKMKKRLVLLQALAILFAVFQYGMRAAGQDERGNSNRILSSVFHPYLTAR